MASSPAQNENQLQLVVVKPNLERRWVLVYNVVPLQSFDPTAELEEAAKEEEAGADQEMADLVHDTIVVVEPAVDVDQPAPVVAAPEPAADHTKEIGATG